MSTSTNSPLTPDAALHSFMDGDLDSVYEQDLFNELSSSTDLRGEMKDVLSIRKTIQQDIAAPPADGEAVLLAGLGLAGAAGVAGATGVAGVAGAAGVSTLGTIAYTAGGLAVGFIAAFLLFANSNGTGTGQVNDGASGNGGAVAGRTTEAPESNMPAPVEVRVDTVYAVRLIPTPMPVQQQVNNCPGYSL